MDSRERLHKACLGEETDRLPYAFWTHLPDVDLDPDLLATHTLDFAREYGIDFIKTMSNGMFSTEDWGNVIDYSRVPLGGVAEVVNHAVADPDDWHRLDPLDTGRGALGRELASLSKVVAGAGTTPVLATVFSPLTTAAKLAGPAFADHCADHLDDVRAGLEIIAETTGRFARAALELGAAGIMFATQSASSDAMSADDFARLGVPFDRSVLETVSGAEFTVMHVHGTNILMDLVRDYPVDGINWHIGETDPSPAAFHAVAPDKTIVGGLVRTHITDGDVTALREEVRAMREGSAGPRVVLTPGCVIRHPVRSDVLHALIEIVKEVP